MSLITDTAPTVRKGNPNRVKKESTSNEQKTEVKAEVSDMQQILAEMKAMKAKISKLESEKASLKMTGKEKYT